MFPGALHAPGGTHTLPPAGLVFGLVQAVHAEMPVAASTVLNVLMGHFTHAKADGEPAAYVLFAYVPMGHGEHADELANDQFPSAHVCGAALPSGQNAPAGHAPAHAEEFCPAPPYRPAGHGIGTTVARGQ